MVREAGQLDVRSGTIGSPGQHNIQDLAGHDRIFAKSLVKITYTKQQQGSRMLGLDRIVLLHQGGFLAVFGFAHG